MNYKMKGTLFTCSVYKEGESTVYNQKVIKQL